MTRDICMLRHRFTAISLRQKISHFDLNQLQKAIDELHRVFSITSQTLQPVYESLMSSIELWLPGYEL